MGPAPTCTCQSCGGRAKLLESRPLKQAAGRRRRYGCQEAGCGFRWSEWIGERPEHSLLQAARAAGSTPAPEAVMRLCPTSCGHWLNGCSMGFPEPLRDPTFASVCAAWLERRP